MSSLNRVQLIGNLGKDPEVRTFQNGGRVCNFSIATSEKWKDKATGETKERTEWHNIAVFADGLVGVIEKFLRKGSKVYVEGQLETRKWQDKDGNDRWSTEVVLRPYSSKLVLLGESKGGGQREYAPRDNSSDGYSQPQGSGADIDDEIPF